MGNRGRLGEWKPLSLPAAIILSPRQSQRGRHVAGSHKSTGTMVWSHRGGFKPKPAWKGLASSIAARIMTVCQGEIKTVDCWHLILVGSCIYDDKQWRNCARIFSVISGDRGPPVLLGGGAGVRGIGFSLRALEGHETGILHAGC